MLVLRVQLNWLDDDQVDIASILLRWRRKRIQTAEEHISKHLILTFSFFQENFYYKVTQTWLYNVKWSIYITQSLTHIYETRTLYKHWEHLRDKIWADPLSHRDGWPSNYIMSCEILLQSMCRLWYYSTSQVSFPTSFILSSLLVGLFWRLTNHKVLQIFSCPRKKNSYVWHWAWHLSIISFFHNL